ncbi:MAG: hypothetical protein LAT67_11945 [Balneolales bacterium]|nr:hypothetical protein [Balneolales bacterium]
MAIELLHVMIRKIVRYPLFWIVSVFFLLIIPMLYRFFLTIDLTFAGQQINLLAFLTPDSASVWQYILFVASYGVYVMILFALSFINRDLREGIWRQYLFAGSSRNDLALALWLFSLGLSLWALLLVVLAGSGIVLRQSHAFNAADFIELRLFFAGFLLHYFVFIALAVALNMLLRNTIMSFLIILLWGLVAESAVRWIDPTGFAHYLPVYNLNGLVPNPILALFDRSSVAEPDTQSVVMSLFWLFGCIGSTYYVLRRKDL